MILRPVIALAFTVAGLVGLTLAYAGTATYEAIAREGGFDRNAFHVPAESPQEDVRYDVPTLVGLHAWTLRYVLEGPIAVEVPRDPTLGAPLFSTDERSHLDDVSTVLAAARIAMLVALAVLGGAGAMLWGSGRPAVLRVLRDSGAMAAVFVAVVGGLAAVAFEPAFLAFHYLFFPQGNFLFDPATSNLLALYPEPYWYGVTLRIGVTYVVLAGAVAAASALLLRARAPEATGTAIVSAR